MTAIVVESDHGKLFLSAIDNHIQISQVVEPCWRPKGKLPEQAIGISPNFTDL